jgi:hypothetical protein
MFIAAGVTLDDEWTAHRQGFELVGLTKRNPVPEH